MAHADLGPDRTLGWKDLHPIVDDTPGTTEPSISAPTSMAGLSVSSLVGHARQSFRQQSNLAPVYYTSTAFSQGASAH
jgi:hypothetical protein